MHKVLDKCSYLVILFAQGITFSEPERETRISDITLCISAQETVQSIMICNYFHLFLCYFWLMKKPEIFIKTFQKSLPRVKPQATAQYTVQVATFKYKDMFYMLL